MDKQIKQLLVKKALGICTDDELARLEQWYAGLHTSEGDSMPGDEAAERQFKESLLQSIHENMTPTLPRQEIPVRPVHIRRRYWWAAAAALLVLVFAGSYFWWPATQSTATMAVSPAQPHDALPGGTKAILTLADGSSIRLDSTTHGTLAQQGQVTISTDSGRLAYAGLPAKDQPTATISYNTLTTPRGGQYRLTLPDGSKVWLDAASSIRYPTAFTGKERVVEVTGEVYFEVARLAAMPFKVQVSARQGDPDEAMEIEVLGTHFNVNAYPDEGSIKTTLLEGSVRVTAYRQSQTISPGQQVQLNKQQQSLRVIDDVDAEQVVAWKNGYFSFTDADLPTVMRQLARWYNVTVSYEGPVPEREFYGKIGRNLTLSQVLDVLGKTRVKYKIEEGRQIVILPQQ